MPYQMQYPGDVTSIQLRKTGQPEAVKTLTHFLVFVDPDSLQPNEAVCDCSDSLLAQFAVCNP